MKKYYTRVCNFYYGKKSIKLLNQKKTLPLKGNKEISFDRVEIISRDSIKSINIKNVKKLPNLLRKKIENLVNKNVYPANKEDLKVEDEGQGSALGSIGLKPKIVH